MTARKKAKATTRPKSAAKRKTTGAKTSGTKKTSAKTVGGKATAGRKAATRKRSTKRVLPAAQESGSTPAPAPVLAIPPATAPLDATSSDTTPSGAVPLDAAWGAPEPAAAPTPAAPQLTLEALTAILIPYMNLFESEMHPELGYCLRVGGQGPDEMRFAGLQVKGEGFYFHLFSLERDAELRAEVAEELRPSLVGESTFRFERIEPELFALLAELTTRAFERLQDEGLAPPLSAA